MKRFFKTLLIASAVSVLAAVPAHAGWETSLDGKDWYYKFDGTENYVTDGWAWLDGEGDGNAECYYFGSDGKLLTDAEAPDGSLVDKDGCWCEADGTVHVMTYERWVREGYTDLAVTKGFISAHPDFDTIAALGDMKYYLSLEAEPASRLNNATTAAEAKKIVEEELVPCEQAICNIASLYPAYEKIHQSTALTVQYGKLPSAKSVSFQEALTTFVYALNDDYDLITAVVNAYLENAEEIDKQIREAYAQAAAEAAAQEAAAQEAAAQETAAQETTAAETAAAETTAAETAAAEETQSAS